MAKRNFRKEFVQARLKATGKEATPEQRAKFRERFNTLSQTMEGRTKLAQVLLPGGSAAQRKEFKASIKPVKSTTDTTDTTDTTNTTKYPNVGGYFPGSGKTASVTSSTSIIIPTTSTTIPTTTSSTTPAKTFQYWNPNLGWSSSTPSNEKDLAVPIVGGILLGGAAAIGTKAYLSSESHIDRITRMRQLGLARQFKASQLTSSSTLTLADRPQFATIGNQRAAAAAATTRAARPEVSYVVGERAVRTPTGRLGMGESARGSRSMLETMRGWMMGGGGLFGKK